MQYSTDVEIDLGILDKAAINIDVANGPDGPEIVSVNRYAVNGATVRFEALEAVAELLGVMLEDVLVDLLPRPLRGTPQSSPAGQS